MKNITSNKEQWVSEYGNKGIPSSFREEPSGSVEYFLNFLHRNNVWGGNALDIGCGTGRNACFLAENGFTVTAMDFVQEMIESIKRRNIMGITPICHDVSEPWPLQNEKFDIAIDTFCFKHQIPAEHRENYKSELSRVMRKESYFLLTAAGDGDGYYAQFLLNSPDESAKIIIDPANGIPSVLYSKDELMAEFNDFYVLHYEHKQKQSEMHGDIYDRSTHVVIFKKK